MVSPFGKRLTICAPLILVFSILPGIIAGQSAIEGAKHELVMLQRQLRAIDARQRLELAKLDEAADKDEFETTEQFEARTADRQARWMKLFNEIDGQQGTEREAVYRRINEILSQKYSGSFPVSLGTYDADKQVFPIQVFRDQSETLSVPISEARDFKENIDDATTFGVIGLSMNMSDEPSEYLVSGRIVHKGKSYAIRTIEFGTKRAMFVMFGNYSPSGYSRLRILNSFGSEETSEEGFARHLTTLPFTENGKEKTVVVTTAAPTLENYSCHACSPSVSVAVFAKESGFWNLSHVQKNIGRFGSFGKVQPPKLVKISPTKFALRFDWYYMQMGHEESSQEYYSLDGGFFRNILSVNDYKSNIGAASEVKDQRKLTVNVTGLK